MKTSIGTVCLGLSLSMAPPAWAQTITTSWSIFVSPAYNAPYGGTCSNSASEPVSNVLVGTGSGEPMSQQLSLGCDIPGLHFQADGNIQVAATGLRLTARAQASTYGVHIAGTNFWPGGRAYVAAGAKGTDVATIGANGDYVYELRFAGTFDARCTSDEQFDGISGSMTVGSRVDRFILDNCGSVFPPSQVVRITGTAGQRLPISVTLGALALAEIGNVFGDPTPTGAFNPTVINQFGDLGGTTTVTADASHTLQFFLTPVTPGAFYTTDSGATYTDPELVSAFRFSGFFSPVDNPSTLNRVKAGLAVPVKFSLAGDRGLDVLEAGFPTSEQMYCDTTAPLDDVETTSSAGNSTLSYDATSDTYTYVWKTQKAWAGTCRRLNVVLSDGSLHTAHFAFVK